MNNQSIDSRKNLVNWTMAIAGSFFVLLITLPLDGGVPFKWLPLYPPDDQPFSNGTDIAVKDRFVEVKLPATSTEKEINDWLNALSINLNNAFICSADEAKRRGKRSAPLKINIQNESEPSSELMNFVSTSKPFIIFIEGGGLRLGDPSMNPPPCPP